MTTPNFTQHYIKQARYHATTASSNVAEAINEASSAERLKLEEAEHLIDKARRILFDLQN